MDLAWLGLGIDSRPIREASGDLGRFSQASGRAERSAMLEPDSFEPRTARDVRTEGMGFSAIEVR
jgi:hypothetical protein